ncbi:uncharacterized protein LOC111086840 [Limulus polyphemus]|uniref:Uncharacterized protein LOC111086840 n=1 Tax=Limulus polyphemus TaxID=6850 RepID=A0ABM1STV5_LIMPO|nr:uncharacterized protein LOC111086840 [Limulus polyphemus]
MIPEDLIAVNTTETIYGPTVFLAPIHVEGNLFVRGKIDKTDLDFLLENRVTLSGNEEIYADFTFKSQVHLNNLEVEKINDVLVSSIVTKTGNHIIKGFKTFSEDLNIGGSLEVRRLNGIDLQYLNEHVVRHNRREVITDFTVFHAPLEVTTSIEVAETVNELDISELAEFFFYESDRLNQELLGMEEIESEQHRALKYQFDAHKYQISELAYFELVQEIDMASTKFFSIPMYTYYRNVYDIFPIHSLLAWRTERTNCDFSEDYCCEVSTTFMFNVAANGTLSLSSGPIEKRIFPFIFHSSVSNLEYTLWTNTTSSRKRCHYEGMEETLVTSVYGDYWEPDQEGSLRIRNSPYVSDAKIFKVDDLVYLAVAFSYDKKTNKSGNTIIYKHDHLFNKWSTHQVLPTYYSVALDLVIVRDYEKPVILLAVANRLAPEGLSGSSTVYSWSYNTHKFELQKEMLTSLPSSVLWVDTGDYLFVLFANERTMLHQNYNWNNLYLEPVNVYLYHNHNFEWVQSVNVRGVHSLSTFRLTGETYVMAASTHLQLVYLLQWSGFAGFKVIQEIPAPGVEHIHVYWSTNEDLMIAVASSTGHTKILKAVIRGTAVTPIEGHPRYMAREYFTNVSYFNNLLLKP